MSLKLSLDHDVFEAGTRITGTLFVVEGGLALSATKADTVVKLVFRGEERTRVLEKASKRSAEASCHLHRSEHVVDGLLQQLQQQPGDGRRRQQPRIVTGKKMPFEVPIPDDLPQTVTIPWTHVSYFLTYEIEDRRGRVVEAGEEIKVIILAKKIVHEPSPFVRDPFSEYVKKNRFKKGNLIITCRIDDVVLEPGEVIGVSVAVLNRSPLRVEKVKAILKQQIHVTAESNERDAERILTFHEFKEYRQLKRKRKKWLRGTDLEEDFEALQHEVEGEEHSGSLRIPKNTTLSYFGQLFDVRHSLHIEIKTSKEDVAVQVVPIEIARKEPAEEAESVVDRKQEGSRVSFALE